MSESEFDFEPSVDSIDAPELFWFRILILVLGFIMQLVGSPMLLAILSYEKFGGDPQKRILVNRLAMHLVYNGIIGNFTCIMTVMLRLLIGPLPEIMVQSMFLFANALLATSAILTLDIMAILRLMSLFVWKRVPPLDDDFFSRFLFLSIYCVSILLAFLGRFGRTENNEMYYILTGKELISNANEPIFRFFGLPMMGTMIVYFAYGLIMLAYKIKQSTSGSANVSVNLQNDDDGPNPNCYNVSAYNPDITNIFVNAVVAMSLLAYLLTIMMEWEDNIVVPNLLGFMIPMFTMNVLLAMRTILKNPQIWTHIKMNYIQEIVLLLTC